MSDLLAALDQVIGRYRPVAAIIYCGENDIAAGRDPIETANDYRELLRRRRQIRPDMKIAIISMKPSPNRWEMWPAMCQANQRMADLYAETGVDFLDVGPLMLGADRLPRPELFVSDRLHMNADGYRIWTRATEAWLSRQGLLGTAGSPSSQ